MAASVQLAAECIISQQLV